MVLDIIFCDNINIWFLFDKMLEIKRERGFFYDKFYFLLIKFCNFFVFSLLFLKFLVCDGGIGCGVRFS